LARNGVWVGCFKDMGSESVVAPPSWHAFQDGRNVSMLIEGKGGERFLKNYLSDLEENLSLPDIGTLAHSPLRCGGGVLDLSMGTDDFKKRPYGFDPMEYLTKRTYDVGEPLPAVVLVGESGPIYAERLIAHAVMRINRMFRQERPIRLVCCQDFWASGIIVAPDVQWFDMAQVNDEYAAELTLKTYHNLAERDIVIRGNPGVKTVTVSDEVKRQYVGLKTKYDTVYFFSGGSEPTTSKELGVLCESLLQTTGSLCLVVGWHPKLAETHGEKWRDIVKTFPCHVEEAVPGTGDQWGVTADVTVSSWSTIMTTAAYAGKDVIAIETPESRAHLGKRGMEQIPQVAMGWAEAISEPRNLNDLGKICSAAREKLVPFDTRKAYEGIAELLERS